MWSARRRTAVAGGVLAVTAAALLAYYGRTPCGLATPAGCLPVGIEASTLNLIVLTLDTTRADRVGAYRCPAAAVTPALDRIADQGVLFEQASSPAPLTLPAHCTLFTGCLPPRHHVHENAGVLGRTTLTLATVLKRHGFRTAAFVGSGILERSRGLDSGFDEYDDRIARSPTVRGRARRHADVVVTRALQWMDAATTAQRFFVWLHFYDAHAPYDPPSPFAAAYRGRPYEGSIAFMDTQIGRLRAYLDRRGLTDRTVIVIVGDHGEGLGDHGELMHGLFVYESVLHVPFIMLTPFTGLSARRVAEPVSSADVMPTVLDLLGIAAPKGTDGQSLVPVISGQRRRGDLYGENLYTRSRFGWSELRTIRAGRLKLIAKTRPELYDLEQDPSETHDLIAQHPALAIRLRERLRSLMRQWEAPSPENEPPRPHLSADLRLQLAALGYVGGGASHRGPADDGALPDPRDHVALFNCLTIPPQSPTSHSCFR
jgi:arylsulfatase A-like enzyme